MSGTYDPPDKALLLADNPAISSTVQLMVAAAEAQFPSKVKSESDASRARPAEDAKVLAHTQARAMDCQSPNRGRKRMVTPERVQLICEALARGGSESAACLRAGIGLTAWNVAKRVNADLRQRIASARDEWARLRHAQRAAALYESQAMRAANRKALKPQPTHQAKLVMWHLTSRAPLNFVAIPEAEIASACAKFNLPVETWRRQERAFGLLKKVYAKRAAIRSQQQPSVAQSASQQFQDRPSDGDGYSY